jgi:hypothetical protein
MTLTLREQMLHTLRGQDTGRTPWNCYGWLLPKTEAAARLCAQGLSRMETRAIFRTRYDGVEMRETTWTQDGTPHFHVEVETPYGLLTEDARLDTSYGSRWITKFLITGPADFPAARYFFEHTHFEADYEPWRQADRELGDAGFVVGEIMPIPVMRLIVSWMGVEGFLAALMDDPQGLSGLLALLDRHYDRQIELAAASPAEIIWFGDNVTATILSPRMYERFCLPVYARVMPIMRAAGKIPIAHYDGSNKPLVKLLARTDLPVIEAFTPPPMGDLRVSEARAAWPEKVIWVNFPGFLFVEPYETIRAYALDLLREGSPAGRFILGCTEDFPMDEFEKTFSAIQAAFQEYYPEE